MEMPTEMEQHAAALERLSSLMDGELDSDSVGPTCAQWRLSSVSQSTWHAYHLIGDVLRSDDLACDPAHDVRFLTTFRQRLANEPVVLAPEPLRASAKVAATAAIHQRRPAWLVPSAMAASFAVVASVLVMTRGPAVLRESPASDSVAQATPPSSAGVRLAVSPVSTGSTASAIATSTSAPSEPQIFVANGQLIRDARLDRYLAAHKQFAGSSALGVPSGFLRDATADATDR
jgi:sigma-E factor negative regulatory protein RseA